MGIKLKIKSRIKFLYLHVLPVVNGGKIYKVVFSSDNSYSQIFWIDEKLDNKRKSDTWIGLDEFHQNLIRKIDKDWKIIKEHEISKELLELLNKEDEF